MLVISPSHVITRQAIHDLRMKNTDFDRVTSQIDGDIERFQKELEVWQTTITGVIAKGINPMREFEATFEASVRREWEAVKEELEKSLLETNSQDRLVSTQITNQLYSNSCFRESSPAGQSIDATLIPISTGWRNLLLPFKHGMLTKFSKLQLKVFKESSMLPTSSSKRRSPMTPGRKSSKIPWNPFVTFRVCWFTG